MQNIHTSTFWCSSVLTAMRRSPTRCVNTPNGGACVYGPLPFPFDVNYFLCNSSIPLYLAFMNWSIGHGITLRSVHVIHQISDGQLENGNGRRALESRDVRGLFLFSCALACEGAGEAKIHKLFSLSNVHLKGAAAAVAAADTTVYYYYFVYMQEARAAASVRSPV